MRKTFIGLVFFVFIFSYGVNALGVTGEPLETPEKYISEQKRLCEDAAYILHFSAMMIFEAQRLANHRHNYAGLALAVGNQQKARELYMVKNYKDAISHSLHARELASKVIKANSDRGTFDFIRNEREERYIKDAPKGEDLDRKLDMIMIDKDDTVARTKFDLDIY